MRLALYTTIHRASLRYLSAWYQSVLSQTDQDFGLWIGVDAIDIDVVKRAIGSDPEATWVLSSHGDAPIYIRQRALAEIARCYDGVVLVDSDDVLHPSRVASARAGLAENDVVGCALRLVDEQGADLGFKFGLQPAAVVDDVLPRHNVLGFSNSAYRSHMLHRCLPIPSGCLAVDWFLATRAWLYGARIAFDSEVRMDYRQHRANMARVLPPFAAQQVKGDTELVRQHFRLIQSSALNGCIGDRLVTLSEVASDVEAFYERVALNGRRLADYVRVLNTLETAPMWWSCVAHPSLQYMWTFHRETA